MAAEEVIINTKVNVSGGDNVKSMRGQMKALKEEIAGLKPGSDAFIEASKKAGILQDKIEDINNVVNAFNPEKKFQAFAGVVGGVANGFAVTQGAMVLFGVESKGIEQAILKTQAAMAIATGINGLLGMGDAFKNLALVIKTNVVSAFSTLKATLITSGIGALIIAIGVLISKVIEYNDAIDKEIEKEKNLQAELDKTTQALIDVAKARELQRNATEGGLDQMQRELALLRARGATAKEVYDQEQKIREREIFNLRVLANTVKDNAVELAKVNKEGLDKVNEMRAAALAYQKDLNEKEKADHKKKVEDIIKNANRLADHRFQQYLEEARLEDQKAKDFEQARQNQIEVDKAFYEFQEQQAQANIELAKKEQEAKLNTYSAIGNGLRELSSIIGETTEAGKVLGVASAVIDTFVGANKALAQGGAFGFISAAAIVLTGLKNVQSILAVNVPKSSGSKGSISGVSSAAPILPPSSNLTRLTNGNDPIVTRTLDVKNNRVYVVETDITNKQKDVASIGRKATIR